MTEEHADAVKVNLLTLRQFNKAIGLPYRMLQDKKQHSFVKEEKFEKLLLTKADRLIIHLQSQKAAVLPKEDWNLVIPSNFVALDFEEGISAPFMSWYFNEHPKIQKQFHLSTQGSTIATLSINMLRAMVISLPPMVEQEKIASIVTLQQHKRALMQERNELENKWVRQQILNKLGEF
ncbi:restriction endonuclease S subunit [Thalassobacillus devorans]|uniref:restriction endonuclease subunit S n=1 Tax=Thalassobacillus devorans TaxID=279813 RepID=UPI000782975E|nr:restriction endonuclease subunit S [Thalassobacillus devorans]NIK28205.1 restriction endonuclease S subunit [Thalassobacillus devorans]